MPIPRPKSTRPPKRVREIRLALDRDETLDAWRVTAECDDELTTMLFIGAASRRLLPTADDLAGDYGRMLVEDHGARCASCRKWAAA